MNEHSDKKIELLAPAGNFDSLRAAVINGADAVYLGASDFSARSKADNFDEENLTKAVKYCHLFGVKVYLAVNTIIKPSEYEKAIRTVIKSKSIGVDAFIIQDLIFLSALQNALPNVKVHLSTQAGIHNLSGAKIAEQLGASRVILSRETLLSDIIEIKNNTSLEIEYFIQGALCVAFSGNCYFSSLAANCSGNRGKCLQFCRKQYRFENRKGYLLSAKDLNLSNKLSELIASGVTSFKIEGRMRRPEYVAESVKHYRELLNGNKHSDENLRKLFNRGDYCSAYLDNPTENIIYPQIQGHKGIEIGHVSKIVGKKAVLALKKQLHAGDGIKFVRNNVETGSAVAQENGFSVLFNGNIKAGDRVNITTDITLSKNIALRERKIPINVEIAVTKNLYLQATAENLNHKTVLNSDFTLEEAKNAPVTSLDLFNVFNKTGDTEFKLDGFSAKLNGDYFIPKSRLNEFRRKLYEKLENVILSDYENAAKKNNVSVSHRNLNYLTNNNCISDSIKTIIQIEKQNISADFADLFDALAFCPQIYDKKTPEILFEIEQNYKKPTFLTLPIISRGEDNNIFKEILSDARVKNVIINNIGQIESAKGKNIIFGPMMNIINPDFGTTAIMSPEYDGTDYGNNFMYSFGKFPLMTFAHCPRKTVNNGICLNCNHEPMSYTDERNNEFMIRFQKIHYCYAQMLNCVPIDDLSLIKSPTKRKFIDLVGYKSEEISEILLNLRQNSKLTANFTRGYLNKKLQ